MTTEPEAHAFLTDLTRLAQALDDAVLDSGLPAASGENAGIARSLPKSKSPCSDSLGDMRRDALAYVQQWVGNLSSDLTIRQPDTEHTGPTLTPWVHWLRRHRVDLIARPWWPDAEEELREHVHRPLADQFTPPDPAEQAKALDGLVTVEVLRERGYKAGTIRQWRNRGVLEEQGTQMLSTGETITLYRFTRPPRS